MKITGLQKLTLLDYPGKVACTVFLGGCNYRCPWCHNSEFLENPQALMGREEFLAYLQSRRGLLDGVCVSGGEPTLHPELPEFLRQIRQLGLKVKLDTNGSRPQVLRALVEEGLVDYVAMDVKNSLPLYAATVGLEQTDTDAVCQSLALLLQGAVDYELRTTLVAPFHTLQSVADMARAVGALSPNKAKRWYLQPFVDRETVLFEGFCAPDEKTLAAMQALLQEAAETVAIRGMD